MEESRQLYLWKLSWRRTERQSLLARRAEPIQQFKRASRPSLPAHVPARERRSTSVTPQRRRMGALPLESHPSAHRRSSHQVLLWRSFFPFFPFFLAPTERVRQYGILSFYQGMCKSLTKGDRRPSGVRQSPKTPVSDLLVHSSYGAGFRAY